VDWCKSEVAAVAAAVSQLIRHPRREDAAVILVKNIRCGRLGPARTCRSGISNSGGLEHRNDPLVVRLSWDWHSPRSWADSSGMERHMVEAHDGDIYAHFVLRSPEAISAVDHEKPHPALPQTL
jgi:hypothetical protein